MRDGIVLLAHLLAVAVEGVALGRPVAAVVVPAVRGLLVLPREVVEPAGVLPVAVPAVAAHDDAVGDEPVGFHDVRLHAGDRGVGRGANAGRLQPERSVPAAVLRQAAADLKVAVALHEERLAVRAERPEAGGVLRNVVGKRSGLEMRGTEVVALAQQVELHGLARHLHALEGVRERREVLSPEAFAAHPLRLVDLRAVELVVPDELPRLAARQEGVGLAGHGGLLHLDDRRLLDLGIDEPRLDRQRCHRDKQWSAVSRYRFITQRRREHRGE